MKNKIITILLVIFFSVAILNLNEVFGVGLVSQCWKYDVDGDTKPDLVYRVFLTPSDALTKEYRDDKTNVETIDGGWTYTYNGTRYASKWRYLLDSTQANVSPGRYLTVKYAFHTVPLGDYSTAGDFGYSSSNVKITDRIPSIAECVAAATAVKTKPKDKYNYDDKVFYEVERITGKYTDVSYGTGVRLSGLKFNKNTQYREAIIRPTGAEYNILAYDHVIYNEDMIKLIAAAKEKGKTEGCYVSQVLIFKNWNDTDYEVSKTFANFWKQNAFKYYDWDKGTRGLQYKALGSVGNLYDNELVFPQMSKRTVLVRHINLGSNTKVSTNTVNSGKGIASTNLKLLAGGANVNGKNYSSTYSGYQEYYEGLIDIDKLIEKQANADTATYRCIGYNVAQGLSHDSAKASLNQLIANGKVTTGNKVQIEGKDDSGDNEVIIIDFYYTEYDQDVVVKHYYTDQDGKVISSAEQTIIPNKTANNGTISRKNNDTYVKEVYPRKMGQSIIVKTATSVDREIYEYKGYQIFTKSDVATGKDISIGEKASYSNKSETATLKGDNVQVNFYYSEIPPPPTENVVVNHYYVDKNGKVLSLAQQTIVPNEAANGGKLARKNNDKYIREEYERIIGENVKVTTATSIQNNSKVKYRGYELFTHEDVEQGKVIGIGKQGNYKYTSKEATLTKDYIQVNFYYETENIVMQVEPEKDLKGEVFVKGTDATISTTCSDTTISGETYNNVTSIPSGTSAKVGIKDIPKYMLGAVTTEYVSPASTTHKMNLTINLTMGKQQSKKIELKNIPYKVGYYKITDMAIYTLLNATVYDADSSGIETVGEGLFNWVSKSLKVNNRGITVEMKGINNRTIKNSTINNINNYVSAQITGRSSATGIKIESGENSPSTTVNIPYIDETEFDKVDANKDSQITEYDREYSTNKLEEYNIALNDAKEIEKTKQDDYDSKLKEQNRLKGELDKAKKELDRLYKIYEEKDDSKISREASIQSIEKDIKTLEETTIPALNAELEILKGQLESLNGELETLQDKYTELTSQLSTLQGELTQLTSEYNQLDKQVQEKTSARDTAKSTLDNIADITKNSQEYINWQNSIAKRNELKMAANCTDSVPEEIYIYLEPSEKEALEQCANAKKEYQENLQNRVVEKAKEVYDKYLDEQTQIAQANLNSAEKQLNEVTALRTDKEGAKLTKASEVTTKETEVSTIEGQIGSKKDEIESKNTEINSKQQQITGKNGELNSKEIMLKAAERDYDSFIKDEWTPAKDAWETYKDNEYAQASSNYTDYVDNKYVETALSELNKAKANTKTAQSNYDEYESYKETLEELYPTYKAMYDEFMSLTNETAAVTLGLKLNLKVQNMSVSLKIGSSAKSQLTESDKNSNTKTFSVKDLQSITEDDDERIPQVTTNPITINKDYYNNIFGKKVAESDYSEKHSIAKSTLNGVRVLAGSVKYEADTLIGDKAPTAIIDTLYYNQNDSSKVEGTTKAFKISKTEITKDYQINNDATNYIEKYKEVKPVNIYTPITVSSTLKPDTNDIVDQTQNLNTEEQKSIIQLNTSFEIELGNEGNDGVYSSSVLKNTSNYVKGYYIKFDFEVHNVYINGRKYKNGDRISPDVWIMIPKPKDGKPIIEAQAYGNLSEGGLDIITEDRGKYTVRAVAYNATDIMLNESIRYDSLADMTKSSSGLKNIVDNICKNPSYFAQEEERTLMIINRIFDFRVTDVKDLNWKSVFRKKSGNSVNNHSGILYYSGTTKWDTTSDESNNIIRRSTSEIGKSPLRTLPIGPYKNTNSTYIKAPKIGYRFSFDLKATGSYYNKDGEPRTNKQVNITTRFYYISKDGKKYLSESNGTNSGIYLFYKTSSGKYVRIDENGGGYNLTFTPNDGYRYLDNGDTSNLSKTSVSLGNLRNITLKHNMATVADNGAVITYYGEYKLPNSTIAVKVNSDGSYDINKPLKNGYIGVIFDIVVESGADATKEVQLSYSKNTDKKKANTSQWDYEGFLGYTNYGHAITEPLSIRLEKGVWKIDNSTYNDIKGTIILYDLDERAATDYE